MNSATWRPQGIWGAVLLPVDKDGAIDFAALAEEIDILCASPLAGIYTNGTAAEFFNQTEAEFERIAEMVATRAARAGKPFQLGVSSTNPRVARARLARIVQLSPTGAQFILPDWWPPAEIEQARFVAGMAETAGHLPLVLYNPPHAKVQLGIADIARLRGAAGDSLVGVKVLGGDADWYAQRRERLADLAVFVGGGSVAFGRPLGADGSYSNMACLSPDGAAAHWDLIETDPAAARDLERRFGRFLRTRLMPLARSGGLSDAALDKLMAAAGGWAPLRPGLMWPHSSATAEQVASVSSAARRELPELFVTWRSAAI